MFYLISIQNLEDGTHPCSIMAYEDKEAALSAFHSTMASNYISTTLKSCSCTVMNDIGGVVKTEYYQVPEPAPEPNAE